MKISADIAGSPPAAKIEYNTYPIRNHAAGPPPTIIGGKSANGENGRMMITVHSKNPAALT